METRDAARERYTEETLVLDGQDAYTFREFQELPWETTGWIAYDPKSGRPSQLKLTAGMQVADLRDPVYNVNFHTHPADYETTYPNHPSVVDLFFVAHSVGALAAADVHLLFAPKAVYAISLSGDVRDRLRGDTDAADRLGDAAQDAYDAAAEKVRDRDSRAFRDAYTTNLSQIGFHVQRCESSPYSGTLKFRVWRNNDRPWSLPSWVAGVALAVGVAVLVFG